MNLRNWAFLLVVGVQACAVVGRPVVASVAATNSRVAEKQTVLVAPEQQVQADDGDVVDDAAWAPTAVAPTTGEVQPHPFADLSDEQLEAKLLTDPESLGPVSIGLPASGALLGGAPMTMSERWDVVNPKETWATPETIAALSLCINRVNDQFPDTPTLPIGDISRRSGGHLRPHVSHQSGRDVDVGYYYSTPERWYTRVTAKNLDRARSWAFVRAMVTDTDVQAIFMDRSVQKLLRSYAEEIGEDAHWLDQLFGGPTGTRRPLITHEKGHKSHIHVRFYNPVAQESGRRLYRALLKHKKITPPTYYIRHKVRRGDTLIRLGRRYGTKAKTIKRANGMRTNRIVAGKKIRIPRRGGVRQMTGAVVIPARRLPPARPTPVAGAGSGATPAVADSVE